MTCPGPGRSSWPRPGPWVWGHDHPGVFPRLGRLRPGLGTAGRGLRPPADGLDAHGAGLGGRLVCELFTGNAAPGHGVGGLVPGGHAAPGGPEPPDGPAPGGLVLVGVAPVFTRRPDYPWGQPPGVVRAMRRALTNRKTRSRCWLSLPNSAWPRGRRRLPPRPGRRLLSRRPPGPWRRAWIICSTRTSDPCSPACPPGQSSSRGRRTGSWTRPRESS